MPHFIRTTCLQRPLLLGPWVVFIDRFHCITVSSTGLNTDTDQRQLIAKYVRMYSRTWIVSTLKEGKIRRYSLSEVHTIQGAFNGIA